MYYFYIIYNMEPYIFLITLMSKPEMKIQKCKREGTQFKYITFIVEKNITSCQILFE